MSEDAINLDLVKTFLRKVKSQLLDGNQDKPPIFFYKRLDIVRKMGDKTVGDRLVPVFAPTKYSFALFPFSAS